MSFRRVYQLLHWPDPKTVFRPSGPGAKINLRLAQAKIGLALNRRPDAKGVKVGIFTPDPHSSATQPPLAILCEFPRRVSNDTLNLAHYLAWNFCRAPLLITIEPHSVRSWSCYEPPSDPAALQYGSPAEITESHIDLERDLSSSEQAARSLQWVQLISGQYFRDRQDRFKPENRVDRMLLSNLKYIRQRLNELGLPYDVIHDLLARVIFIQFLFQRKDKNGEAALNEKFLRKRYEDGTLSRICRDLGDILSDYQDAYRFFRFLNERFNGDLFPGKGATTPEREAEWQAEMRVVKPPHLKLLAQFVSGRVEMDRRQPLLWSRYSFDAIPLEFISTIYDVFVSGDQTGAHYTRAHLVDFMLDGVLPWNSKDWNLRILDPACGSGIFLVKSFYRLVQRWKNANPGKTPSAALLKSILERNLFGVDVDSHAVRVASFSLYLAMCDEIDPRWYWQKVKFPRLRDRQVVQADFFYDEEPLFQTEEPVEYNLIVGNAPWGKDSLKKSADARRWAETNNWSTSYNDIGPLFIAKALAVIKITGCVAMILPAGLLFNAVAPAERFRKRLFSEFKTLEVVNLSALRFELFSKAVAPACIITMDPSHPDGEPFPYVCPKPSFSTSDDFRIVVEPMDENLIYQQEATADTIVWSALMWGGRRDLKLVRDLQGHSTLAKFAQKGVVKKRQGIIRGDKKKLQKQLLNRRMVNSESFSHRSFLRIDSGDLPINNDAKTDSRASTDMAAFQSPQLFIKQSWQIEMGRFEAALNTSSEGAICSRSFTSAHTDIDHQHVLEAACLSYNSSVAVYHLLLASGRFATYRPEPTVADVLSVPIPEPRANMLDDLHNFRALDDRTYEAFSLKSSERVLIEDLNNFTLMDFKGDASSPGRQRTIRMGSDIEPATQEPHLAAYCDTFLRVLEAAFGPSEPLCATIYQDDNSAPLPLRLIAIHLERRLRQRISIETITSENLRVNLRQLHEKVLSGNRYQGAVRSQRVATIYDSIRLNGRSIPTFYFVKPDQVRYWLRSAALRDADAIVVEMLEWSKPKEAGLRKRA